MRVLVAVDMQNDFLTGSLANEEGVKTIPNVIREIKSLTDKDILIFTKDTHMEDYLETLEGKNLPVKHCIVDTPGWEVCKELDEYINTDNVICKETFGSVSGLSELIKSKLCDKSFSDKDLDEIRLVGVCTDICVISNAMILKAIFTQTPIKVVEDACAGVTIQSHKTALEAMKMCQIEII